MVEVSFLQDWRAGGERKIGIDIFLNFFGQGPPGDFWKYGNCVFISCCGGMKEDDRVPSGVVSSEGALGEGRKGWGQASFLQTDLVCEQVVVE